MMQQSRTFMRARAIAFGSIAFLAFVWTTLLIVLLSLRWAVSSKTDRAFIVAFLVMDLITVFILPILLLCRFRPWLDAARLSFLLIFHFSLAGVFASQFEGITCTDHSLDGPGVCALFNTLLLMASWVIPVLLAIYGVILAWYAHRNRNFLHSESDRDSDDETVVSSDFGGKEKRETISTFNDRARKVESYQPWRPYSATSPTKPSLTITIPPPTVNPNLPSVERTATTSATAYDDRRSPFAPRPSPSATRGRRSSSSTSVPSVKRPQSQPPSARSQQKPARPRSQPPASRNRRQTMPSPLSLHDGDRIKTGAELATQKRQSAGARKNSLPSSNLQLLSVEHALPGCQFGSLPSRGRRASSSMSAGSTGASPANQFATWGWSVPAARPGLGSHAKSNSISSRSPTSTVSGSLKHDSVVSSRRPSAQLLAVDSFESGKSKGRLVKQPDIAL